MDLSWYVSTNSSGHHSAPFQRCWPAENNQDSRPDELDLHGLFVKEAIQKTDQAIVEAQQRGDSQIRIIVGKGLHSEGSVAKLKPAVEELMTKYVHMFSLEAAVPRFGLDVAADPRPTYTGTV